MHVTPWPQFKAMKFKSSSNSSELHGWLLSLFAFLFSSLELDFFILLSFTECVLHACVVKGVFWENSVKQISLKCLLLIQDGFTSHTILCISPLCLYCKVCGSRLHTWMLVSYHKFASVTSVTNKYFSMPIFPMAASVLVHHWRSSAVPAGDGEGCHVQTKPLRREQRRTRQRARTETEWRSDLSRRVLSLFCSPFDHPLILISLIKIPLVWPLVIH